MTDVMTYKWGGMAGDDAPEPPTEQLIALKKVSYSSMCSDSWLIVDDQVQFAGNAFYDTGIYWPKLAILALYFRLVPATMPWLRKALYAISIFTVGAMIATFFLDTFWCGRDPSPNWSVEEGACSTFTSKEVFRIDWAMNVTSDVFSMSIVYDGIVVFHADTGIVFILPFPLLHQLQLNRRQIWGLVATFSLGAVTITMSIVRFATIEIIYAWTNVCMWHFPKLSKCGSSDPCVVVLSMAEMAVAIMVVSLPSMRHWLRRGGLFSSNKNSGNSSSRSKYGLRTPIVGSNGFSRPIIRGKPSGRGPIDEDSGSEVELNIMGRKDVIYETRRISVEFSDSADYHGAPRSGKLS